VSRYVLEVREGGRVQTIPIHGRAILTVGRAQTNRVQLLHPLVSGRHAEIEVVPEGVRVTDLGSKNGTWINGGRVEAPTVLTPADSLAIGPFALRVREEPREDAAEVTILEAPPANTRVLRSIETGDEAMAAARRALHAAGRNLGVMQKMGRLMLDATDEDSLVRGILDLAFEVFAPERAAVILRGADGELDPKSARARTAGDAEFALPRTIMRQVAEESRALLTADAATDDRFKSGQSIVIQGIRAAMCAPLRGGREPLGVLYLDTRMRRDAFRKDDLELLTSVGIQGGVALENLRLLKETLANERLAAVGGVVAGLSHDIRNILTTLRGGAFVLDRMLAGDAAPDLKEAWQIVKHGADTIGALVDDMVSYSKVRTPDRRPLDLNALTTRVVNRFRASRGDSGTTISAALAADLGAVPLEGPAIERVLTNLLSNAYDALEGCGGNIVVRTAAGPGEDEVSLSVTDDGPGIPPENRERIFDLLFSTKGAKGTGFGLAVTKKIVTEHGGSIRLATEVGKGASFTVVLPRV
jgi:signal transduction histidine kinase